MIMLLFARSRLAPAEMLKLLTILVPAALLGVPLVLILALPAVTLSDVALTFSNWTLPSPALVIVLPVAVRLPVIATPVPADDVTVRLSFSTIGAEMMWVPAVTLIAAWPKNPSKVIALAPEIV